MVLKQKKYIQLDPIEHIMKRPDMYCGSLRSRTSDEYISVSDLNITKSNITFSPAILRIFIEVLSNAIDNVKRSKDNGIPCKAIKVVINKETGETSVWNDGDVVPIEINEECDCYNHTMIFGRLLTGSNYDDEEDRIVAGRNGLGSKLCNVFSSEFSVEGVDPSNHKYLKQTWTNNMRNVSDPVVRKSSIKNGYTYVKWFPDFKQFGIEKYTDDIVQLYTKHVIDAAMISGVKVSLNNQLITSNTLVKYASLYSDTRDKLLLADGVLLSACSTGKFESVSFVNGVFTKLGGQHVDAWSEAIFRPIVDKLNSKNKKSPNINISDVKQFFRLFVVSSVIRPEFDGQDKNKLESPAIKNAHISSTQLSNIMKWKTIDNVLDIIRSKEMLILKKSERTGKKIVKIDGFDPANNAGGSKSSDCTMIVCEGLSAKTYAVAGIEKGVYGTRGRDWYGILPLTGKILNVRNASATMIGSNKVVTNLIKALNCRHGVDYMLESNYKTLNYGRLMIMTDADCDGIHIEGLIMNLFHSLFPSLLYRTTPFIVSMKTPIARVGKNLLFYDETRFNEWMNNRVNDKVKVKYYKGLGTTKTEDVADTFGTKMVEYVHDDDATDNMNKIFNKVNPDDRKKWLGDYNPGKSIFSLDDQPVFTQMSITNFLDREMIKFSHSDCGRSIPNGIDGLKESQRKILYAVIKRKLKYNGTSLKVAQLSGYTAEHSNYHHGEQNLQDTMIGMAHDFVGSNNIPLLYRDGQFGTRLDGGNDAASARYIFTKMDRLTEFIYRDEDDAILTYVNDDGDTVQPEYYVPIIPMILVNGCLGIGTGWSSSIPCYNPSEMIESIKTWLDSDGDVFERDEDGDVEISMFNDLIPWYRGFEGDITKCDNGKFETRGIVKPGKKKNTYEITELPIGMWTNKFKDLLEDLVNEKKLKSMKNYSTPNKVSFIVTTDSNGVIPNERTLKLSSCIHTTNMVVFNDKQKIVKYNTVDEVIDAFCHVRLDFYKKRKKHQLKIAERRLVILVNKMNFIESVISGGIVIMNRKEEDIIDDLKSKNIEMVDDGYGYLLGLQVRTFTKEKVDVLRAEIKKEKISIKELKSTTEKQIWLRELDELEKNYMKK